jgi:hypothetical protein
MLPAFRGAAGAGISAIVRSCGLWGVRYAPVDTANRRLRVPILSWDQIDVVELNEALAGNHSPA